MVKYYQHKDNPDVICEVFGDGDARFGKWIWKGNVCSEHFTFKEITDGFHNTFKEITQREFNDVWGNKLAKA